MHTARYGDICPKTKSTEMKLFVSSLAIFGLGFFCGPLLDATAQWRHYLHDAGQRGKGHWQHWSGVVAVAVVMLSVGAGVFTVLEGWTVEEAMYFSVITGTTIGY